MTTINDLTTVEAGTELAVTRNQANERWTWDGQHMNRNGSSVDPWFFSGLLADGHVVTVDSLPPMLGDWFQLYQNPHYLYCCVADADRMAGRNPTTTTRVSRFAFYYRGEFREFTNVTLDDTASATGYVRTTRPDWSSQQMEEILRQHEEMTRARNQLQRAASSMDTMRTYARRAKEYIDSINMTLNPTTSPADPF